MAKKKSTTGRTLTRREEGKPASSAKVPKRLVADLRKMIDESRHAVAQTVNTTLVWLNWSIGRRIREDILNEKRAEYGEQIVATLSQRLTAEYGRGFSRQNLFRMIRFAEVFPDQQIVSSLMRQLSWTHFIYIIPLDDPLRRLVAIDLKLDRFQAADKGQMELYLRWLEEHEQQPGEESPLGLILCAGKSDEHVKLLRLGESGIRVAAYLTELPPRKLLEKKLRDAVRKARAQLESQNT